MTDTLRNPSGRDLIELLDDSPDYPLDAFDPDGYLTVDPAWICTPDGTDVIPDTGILRCTCSECYSRRTSGD